ncbi:MAG: hypothetical protein MPJ78_18395 [Hyphomicrobiaceae bacterium]|nr:hypothetical protein [Hyphomicrobiaceae bacterium]
MRLFKYVTLGVVLLACAAGETLPAKAAPFSAAVSRDGLGIDLLSYGLVHKVHGCHSNRLYNRIYKRRYPVWHKHLPDCAPVPARPPINRGIIYRDGLGYYCHPEWRKHRHPGFRNSWHRHAGRNCYVSRGWEWKGGPRHNCKRVGKSWICG